MNKSHVHYEQITPLPDGDWTNRVSVGKCKCGRVRYYPTDIYDIEAVQYCVKENTDITLIKQMKYFLWRMSLEKERNK